MSTNSKWSRHVSLPSAELERWRKTLDAQHGAISNAQLREFGLSHDFANAQIEARRWQLVVPDVYAVFTGPLPRSSLISAALCYGGPWAVLSHRTAAEEWGMLPIAEGEPVHITVPYKKSAVSQLPIVHVHRSRAFHHIVAQSEPPRTNREDTVIDVAVSEPTAAAARDRLVQLVGANRLPVWRVQAQLEFRPPYRYRKALKDALQLLTGGALSVLEAEYLRNVEQAHGLPTARRQAPFVVDEIVLWEDVVYDDSGVRLTVRLDGREFHETRRIAFRDRRRDNAAELAERARLTYGWHDVRTDPCGVAREVVTVLRREGWQGSPRSCPRCPG
ncbi:hypothetical protein ABT337_31885 [Saccharopolyspora hirsuta]|uniref:Transcriptional regulator, AbiEi antitoxin, Type IV TA system n=1 Tax=Saccharopolyspora hirsuta TaxID=1837 RepID=A0A5M7BUY7_SACHI|nr:hypothetical protein [Saccharopolyspora hirsuta]KAA5830195.1 hypothetical protein F1721_24220 [Saccharopolyspora hirsuta]